MLKLQKKLKEIKASNKPGFMMHIVAGYPDMKSSEKIALKILDSGADILEIQIPFSDPLADGPVIASACEASLKNGTQVEACFNMMKRIILKTQKPILIMTYFNILHHYGIEKFCKKARSIGIQGVIVPDYPYDEEDGNKLLASCHNHELAFIQVIASTTKEKRMKNIIKNSSGFVYCMARTGTTGKKTIISEKTQKYLKTVQNICSVPMAVGFGISDRKQVDALKEYADIIVVGSALIREYSGKSLKEGLKAVEEFISQLKEF